MANGTDTSVPRLPGDRPLKDSDLTALRVILGMRGLTAQQEAQLRQLALAQQLRQQQMPYTQEAGRFIANVGPWAALANLGNVGAATGMQSRAEQKLKEIAQQQQERAEALLTGLGGTSTAQTRPDFTNVQPIGSTANPASPGGPVPGPAPQDMPYDPALARAMGYPGIQTGMPTAPVEPGQPGWPTGTAGIPPAYSTGQPGRVQTGLPGQQPAPIATQVAGIAPAYNDPDAQLAALYRRYLAAQPGTATPPDIYSTQG